MKISIHFFMWTIGFFLGIALNYFVLENAPELQNAMNGPEDFIAFCGGGAIVMSFFLYGWSKSLAEVLKGINSFFMYLVNKFRKKEVEWSTV